MEKVKKILNTLGNIIVVLIAALAIFMMIFTVISVRTFNQTDRNLFGYKAFIVQSDSMSATDFDAGDLIFTKEVDPSTLKEGDIIAYISQNEDYFGEVVTHKIRRLTTTSAGAPGFITYGTTTNTDDKAVVTYSDILGKYKGNIPKIGTFFTFLKTTPGYILCIFVPFTLLILYQIVNCVLLFRRYRKEQLDEMEAERAQIAEERRQAAQVLEELQALKAQLGQSSSQADQPRPESIDDQLIDVDPNDMN